MECFVQNRNVGFRFLNNKVQKLIPSRQNYEYDQSNQILTLAEIT